MATIAVIGTLDSKGKEHAFLAEEIRSLGHAALLVDVGSGGEPCVNPDITREEVAAAAGVDLVPLLARQDRGECVVAMAKAAPVMLEKLRLEGRIDGVISLGGGGGTAIATAAMRPLPIGFPKVMVSTLASGNTAHYLGESDINMMPSIVDVAGLNRISRMVFRRAAASICGMVSMPVEDDGGKPLIVASMFGNTTECIDKAMPALEKAGFEVLVFHATGAGGRTMEKLIDAGMVEGVLDMTTTEWADEYVGGTLGAGPERMDAARRAGVPVVVAPGCLDMVNFGERESVPSKFENRKFYIHNPQVTLMRTNEEESKALGGIIAEKVNAYEAPAAVLLPLEGVSVISREGQPFHDSLADQALFASIRSQCTKEVIDVEDHINGDVFPMMCAEKLLELIALNRGDACVK